MKEESLPFFSLAPSPTIISFELSQFTLRNTKYKPKKPAAATVNNEAMKIACTVPCELLCLKILQRSIFF